MLLALAAVAGGLVLLVLSADRFIDGAATLARLLGLSPLLIGMVVIGFGSSMPEMLISALSASSGSPEIAVGNAIGSNIANIALILGCAALIAPIQAQSRVLRRELPLLCLITLLLAYTLLDRHVSALDGALLCIAFGIVMSWTLLTARRHHEDRFATGVAQELTIRTPRAALLPTIATTLIGLIVLVASSRLLVWGCVSLAKSAGVSELLIGLTIVALGTSLPELVSAIIAARRHEHELALGNVLGSNLFNASLVVGIAALIEPAHLPSAVLYRDLPVLLALTFVLVLMCWSRRGPGRINRHEGGILLAAYFGYNGWLVITAMAGST